MPRPNVPFTHANEAEHRRQLAFAVNEIERTTPDYDRTAAEIAAGITPTDYRYEPGNVLRYGAIGDDVNDDTTALANAALASRYLYFPVGTYRTTAEIAYDSDSPVYIVFAPGAILKTVGATNRAIHISGSPASSTSVELELRHVTIEGANSGVADCAIFLDQTALTWLRGVVIRGNSKFTDGIYGHGAQQGEIHGGYIRGCNTACIHLDRATSVPLPGHDTGSNGLDIHGMSLSSLGGAGSVLFLVENTDSVMFHHNHGIGALIGVDVNDCQSGCRISNNHIEAPTGPPAPFTAGIRVRGSNSQGARLDGNTLFGTGPGILIAAGKAITVDSNSFIECDLQYDAGVESVSTRDNYSIASGAKTFTDNSTLGVKSGNRTVGTGIDWGDTLSPAQITANQDNYNPTGLSKALKLRLSTDASRTLTGLAGGWADRTLKIINVGAQDLVLSANDAASTAANRFEFNASITLSPAEGITLEYDGAAQRWYSAGRSN